MKHPFHGSMLLALFSLCVLGCSRDARLYPANLEAGPAPIKAKFVDSGMGTGPVELTLPTGEIMRGEFGTTDTSAYGFGITTASIGRTSAFGTSSASAVPGSMPGVVALVGDRGTNGRCEYMVNTWTGSGTGACEMSNGARYNMHF